MNSNKIPGLVAALASALVLSSPALGQEAGMEDSSADTGDAGGGGGGGETFTSGGQVDQWRIGGGLHLMIRGGALGGVRGFADFPLHQFFTLGPEVMIGGGGGGALFTFNALPKGRLPMLVGGKLLEPYVAVPMGLAVFTGGGGAAFNWGVMPGCSYFFNDFIGAHVELGVNGFAGGGGGFAGFAMNLGVQFLM
jgi:hypothetical protein